VEIKKNALVKIVFIGKIVVTNIELFTLRTDLNKAGIFFEK